MIPWDIIAEFAVAIGTIALAGATGYNVYISQKEIKIKYYTEKIEGFYLPLIDIFSSLTQKCHDTYINLERIIKEKAYLAESKTQNAFPSEDSWRDNSFNSLMHTGCLKDPLTELIIENSGMYYYIEFLDKKFFDEWQNFADAIWEDYIDILKELNRLKGIKVDNEPKKPGWKLKIWTP
jgi:hypothetical protein